MQRSNLVLSLAFSFGLFSQALLAAKPVSITLLADQSQVEFQAKDSVNVLKFTGKAKGVAGSFKVSDQKVIEGKASVQLGKLDTELEKRNEHMYDHLNIKTHPEAFFKPTLLPWTDPSEVLNKETNGADFEGLMTLNGVEKAVKGKVSSKPGKDGTVDYNFEFPLDFTEFDIKSPSFLGVKVDKNVKVSVNTTAKVIAL